MAEPISIKIGDELKTLENDFCVVTAIDRWGRIKCVNSEGNAMTMEYSWINNFYRKTGNNYYQIAEVLDRMNRNRELAIKQANSEVF